MRFSGFESNVGAVARLVPTGWLCSSVETFFAAWVDLFDDVCFPFTVDHVQEHYTNQRKRPETRVKVEAALVHRQWSCFWEHRGKGPCSQEVEGGHILQNRDGHALTVANCLIECRAHNNQRANMTIEEYLLSNMKTETLADVV